jgi:hypothetical protein
VSSSVVTVFQLVVLARATPEQWQRWGRADPEVLAAFGDALAHAACEAAATGVLPVLDLTAPPPLPPEVQRALTPAPDSARRAYWRRTWRRWRAPLAWALFGAGAGLAVGVWL